MVGRVRRGKAKSALMIVRLAPGPARPGDVHLFRAGPEELPPIWRRLRAVHGKSGLWPLILGTDDDIAVLEDFPRPTGRPKLPAASP